MAMLSKGGAPVRAEHHFNEYVVDLVKDGQASASLDDILDPTFWIPGHEKLKVSDELRVIGPMVDAKIRIITSGATGVVVEPISGGAVAVVKRSLWVCRADETSGNWMATWAVSSPENIRTGSYDDTTDWALFAAPRTSLPSVMADVAEAFLKAPPFDLTVTSKPLTYVQWGLGQLDPENGISADGIVYCPEGRASPDLWRSLSADHSGFSLGDRFHVSHLVDKIALIGSGGDEATRGEIHAQVPGWKKLYWQVNILIRPNWRATELAPGYFPDPEVEAAHRAEADRMADEFRRRKKARAMPNDKRPRGWAANPDWWRDLP
jgi:hypothetical protein